VDETAFEAALIEEIPLVHRGLRRRFPDTAERPEAIAAAARVSGKKCWSSGEKLPIRRDEFFGWLYGIAFRRHVVRLVAAELEPVRESLTPLCRRLNVDREDVMQEAWLRAQRSIESRGEDSLDAYSRDDARRWFGRIAFNVAHDCRRGLNRSATSELDHDPAAPVMNRANLDALTNCIGGLPDDERQAVQLLLEGRKPARLAEKMAVPIQQVYYLIRRAKLHLRECLGDEENRP